jgi:phosphoglycolate phosphatase
MESRGHIIFDCDGTLISSHDKIIRALHKLVEEEMKTKISIDFVTERYTTRLDQCFHNFGIDASDQATRERLNRRWQELDHDFGYDFNLYDGFPKLLSDLKNNNYQLYVWTARGRASTIEILKKLGIASLFTDFRCGDDTIRKPHPMGLEELVGGQDKKKCIMVGDSYSDVEGANYFGIASIGALWGESKNEQELKTIGATFLAYHPDECLKIVNDYFEKGL